MQIVSTFVVGNNLFDRFYTDEGNWDLVGNNTPIFFIRDPILFPSFIHTQKRNPATHLAGKDNTFILC